MVEPKKVTRVSMQPVKPMIDVSFWLAFTKAKLDMWKLETPQVDLTATISLPNNPNLPSDLLLSEASFKDTESKQVFGGLISSHVSGLLLHMNTIEEFNSFEFHTDFLDIQHKILLAQKEPLRFVLVVFGDLKNYKFYFRFTLLSLCTDHLEQVVAKRLSDQVSADELATLTEEIASALFKTEERIEPFTFFTEKGYLVFLDPSPKLPSELLGNFLVTQIKKTQQAQKVILVREKVSKLSKQLSLQSAIFMEVTTTKPDDVGFKAIGDLRTKVIELKSQMDQASLAEQAVGLNLKLMKWRMVPELDLNVLAKTKCLLLGAGSLGCQVARNLLSWGYTHITFVDNGRVSYSNPVRQCLFTFEDSQAKDNFKAQIAAKRLKEVYPKVETRGVKLSIPMPGHAVGENPEVQGKVMEDLRVLEELVKEHDVVFLLLDSREARWLPTILAHAHQKICLTVALGFDTFLVMRHGLSEREHAKLIQKANIPKKRLGCYFCNDVVAPTNSLQDRTLDQQCTVSRPALCCMASSISVELLTSLLNHPLGHGARAHEEYLESDRSILGILPQQIRGNLNTFNVNCLYGEGFDKCSGCCPKLVEAFEEDRATFLLRACNERNFIEDLTGISAMVAEINYAEVESFNSDDFECL